MDERTTKSAESKKTVSVKDLPTKLKDDATNVKGGKASFNDFNFTHHVDKASPVLL